MTVQVFGSETTVSGLEYKKQCIESLQEESNMR